MIRSGKRLPTISTHPAKRIICALALLAVAAAGAEGLDTDNFVSDRNPGKGSLLFHRDKTTEHVDIGALAGHYGFGLVFKSSLFPEAADDFKGKYLLQIALGNLHPRETQKLPQFSAIALLCKTFPDTAKIYPVVANASKSSDFEEKALILFNSPQTSPETPDEDRLKNTLFGKGGTVSITPMGVATSVDLRGQGETVKFLTQTYHVEFKTVLVTPFQPGDGTLSGTVDLPVFWPHGKAAEKYASQIATKSLSNMEAVKLPEGITAHKRELSGSTRKNKDSSPPPLPDN